MNIPTFSAEKSLYYSTSVYMASMNNSVQMRDIYPAQIRHKGLTGVGGFGRGRRELQANFTCSGLRCDCTGDADCNDMFSSNVCGDIASCDESGCACLRI